MQHVLFFASYLIYLYYVKRLKLVSNLLKVVAYEDILDIIKKVHTNETIQPAYKATYSKLRVFMLWINVGSQSNTSFCFLPCSLGFSVTQKGEFFNKYFTFMTVFDVKFFWYWRLVLKFSARLLWYYLLIF